MLIKYFVVNVLTLFIAVISIFAIRYIEYPSVYGLILCLAWFTDAVDGPLARKLKVTSKAGDDIDRLVDYVAYGVVPGTILIFYGLDYEGSNFWLYISLGILFIMSITLRITCFLDPLFSERWKINRSSLWQPRYTIGMSLPIATIIFTCGLQLITRSQYETLGWVCCLLSIMSLQVPLPFIRFKKPEYFIVWPLLMVLFYIGNITCLILTPVILLIVSYVNIFIFRYNLKVTA
ncbi:CDP-alcohol phosphatidyltransferase family protein [Pectobacterium parvum]|uniref:CDP-alcohol phosphatidyltransferase family protein n=1 Tax=Pectobacterium TaxID=122277 RepID=UPI000CD09B1D|nr:MULTISPECIES: CDP-alcohol phosphatidyltransferase family protein [Pectobacterium]POE06269.1 hypothetical protein BV921_22670 [Pectobacterium odoriferum]UFK41093.1 CDP-alcohol phosphatidyltransferase family protein [Pectobacterium parvum]GKW44178.1 hypothetical protein PEC301879_40360 [Pectobacterium carotovorum subsp. carotovorum]